MQNLSNAQLRDEFDSFPSQHGIHVYSEQNKFTHYISDSDRWHPSIHIVLHSMLLRKTKLQKHAECNNHRKYSTYLRRQAAMKSFALTIYILLPEKKSN